MKILFVVKSKEIETLGTMYLSSVVKQAGHKAKIVDIIEAPTTALAWEPDVIGYSVMTGDQEKFIRLNHKLKAPLIFTSIFGGPHASFFPDDFKDNDEIDYIVQGEAENWMAEYLGYDVKYADIDSIPWADREDFKDYPIRDFIASRGCNHNCSYCYNSTWNKMFPSSPIVKVRDAEDVVSEIASTNPEFVYFQDSNFGVRMSWLRKFTEEYKKKVNVPYHIHSRPNLIDEDRAFLLHDSGCVSMKCALETASDKLKALINRGNMKNGDVYTASKWLKKYNIQLILQNILGLPTSTIEDDLYTLEVNIKTQPAYAWCSIFQPYPSTVLADFCIKERIYTGDFSEIADNFFDKSLLNFTDEHKEQIAVLQRIFAFCVEMQVMPEVDDLTWERLPKFIHSTMRTVGDRRMFPNII